MGFCFTRDGLPSGFNPGEEDPTPALPEIGEGEERDAPSDDNAYSPSLPPPSPKSPPRRRRRNPQRHRRHRRPGHRPRDPAGRLAARPAGRGDRRSCGGRCRRRPRRGKGRPRRLRPTATARIRAQPPNAVVAAGAERRADAVEQHRAADHACRPSPPRCRETSRHGRPSCRRPSGACG